MNYICKKEKVAIELIEKSSKELDKAKAERMLDKANKIYSNIIEVIKLRQEGLL